MSDERRQHYRVSPSTEREVRVAIRTSQGAEHFVGLIDISAGGVALACRAVDAPPVSLMDAVTIVFDSDRLGSPLEIESQVRHVQLSDDDVNIMYGVRFLGWTGQRDSLTPKLRSLFNEREAVRVDPREDEDIEVELSISGKAKITSGMLRDISVLGVGVWVNTDDGPLLEEGSKLTLTLRLPDGQDDIEFDAEIRHMQPLGEHARLGVEIQEGDTARKQRRGITGYVMSRQIEIARIDAERRRAMESYYPSS